MTNSNPTKNSQNEGLLIFENLEAPAAFQSFLSSGASGIRMVSEDFAEGQKPILKQDAGDFAKWVKTNAPAIDVSVDEAPRLMLQSNDYWLPLIYLAKDVGLPIYLNLVSSYLFEKAKGMLKGQKPIVHFSVVYEDKKKGIVKKVRFTGDSEALVKVVKTLDL